MSVGVEKDRPLAVCSVGLEDFIIHFNLGSVSGTRSATLASA
jgi:hypothetical protein